MKPKPMQFAAALFLNMAGMLIAQRFVGFITAIFLALPWAFACHAFVRWACRQPPPRHE